jgi:hypothetical protein
MIIRVEFAFMFINNEVQVNIAKQLFSRRTKNKEESTVPKSRDIK